MENIEQAKWLVEAFKKLTHETRLWAIAGDRDAAKDLMSQMAAENLLLRSLGYMLDDNGTLVKHKLLSKHPWHPNDFADFAGSRRQ